MKIGFGVFDVVLVLVCVCVVQARAQDALEPAGEIDRHYISIAGGALFPEGSAPESDAGYEYDEAGATFLVAYGWNLDPFRAEVEFGYRTFPEV